MSYQVLFIISKQIFNEKTLRNAKNVDFSLKKAACSWKASTRLKALKHALNQTSANFFGVIFS